jgi:hypothetical protein
MYVSLATLFTRYERPIKNDQILYRGKSHILLPLKILENGRSDLLTTEHILLIYIVVSGSRYPPNSDFISTKYGVLRFFLKKT